MIVLVCRAAVVLEGDPACIGQRSGTCADVGDLGDDDRWFRLDPGPGGEERKQPDQNNCGENNGDRNHQKHGVRVRKGGLAPGGSPHRSCRWAGGMLSPPCCTGRASFIRRMASRMSAPGSGSARSCMSPVWGPCRVSCSTQRHRHTRARCPRRNLLPL
ncbi:hypothetical protein DSECCO2_504240 [anaerobic digester metagenome]